MKWNKRCEFDPDTKITTCCWTDKTGKEICEPRENILTGKNSWKTALLLICLAFSVFIISYALAVIPSFLDSEVNPRSVYLYDQDNTIIYRYNDGDIDSPDQELVIDIETDDDYTDVTVSIDGTDTPFKVHSINGTVKGTNKNTIFWFFASNPLGTFENPFEEEYEVIDPAGVLGEKNGNYTAKIGDGSVWWSEEPAVFGAQASFEVKFWDDSGKKIGSGLIDATSGILETLDGKIEITLEDPGNFPMSRHRLTSFWWMVGMMIGIPLVVGIVMKLVNYSPEEIQKWWS